MFRAPIVRVSDEVLLEIFSLLGSFDCVNLLRVCSELHFLAARSLYTDVAVRGRASRRFFATLALKTHNSSVYATFLRRLRFTATSKSDSYLTYPVFSQALLTMTSLVALDLDISHGTTRFDSPLISMQRYGLLLTRVLLGTRLAETVSKASTFTGSDVVGSSLPRLRGLWIGGDPTILPLICHRKLEELALGGCLDSDVIGELCRAVDRSIYGHYLVTLVIRVDKTLKTEAVVEALAEVLPLLVQLSLDQNGMDPMSVLNLLAAPRMLFQSVRRLALNSSAISRRTSFAVDGNDTVFTTDFPKWIRSGAFLFETPFVIEVYLGWWLAVDNFSLCSKNSWGNRVVERGPPNLFRLWDHARRNHYPLRFFPGQIEHVPNRYLLGFNGERNNSCDASPTVMAVLRYKSRVNVSTLEVTFPGSMRQRSLSSGLYPFGGLTTRRNRLDELAPIASSLDVDIRPYRKHHGLCSGGRYLPLVEIGRGASGVVWRSMDTRSGRLVAVKILHPTREDSVGPRRAVVVSHLLFSRSAGQLCLFARVLDYGTFDRAQFMVYPLYAMSLARLTRTSSLNPLPRSHVRDISRQIAVALAYLHSINLIHTDVKPANVVLVDDRTRAVEIRGPSGTVLLKDVLRDTSVKLVDLDDCVAIGPLRRWMSGTAGYRAPEVLIGVCVVDIFSLGCVMGELYIGRPVFWPSSHPRESVASLEWVTGISTAGYGSISRERDAFRVCDPPGPTVVARPSWIPLSLDPARRPTVAESLAHPFFDVCSSAPSSRFSHHAAASLAESRPAANAWREDGTSQMGGRWFSSSTRIVIR
ncbi:kinase-like domain-containing protein [Mycena vitilis]|nr:kinase-like domain-containing protein [Mycena vitilis]